MLPIGKKTTPPPRIDTAAPAPPRADASPRPEPESPSPTGRYFQSLADAGTVLHPDIPLRPEAVEPMTPRTAAFTHLFDRQTRKAAFGRELGFSGQPTPDGLSLRFSQKSAIRGGTHGIQMDPEPGDTHVGHTHPGNGPADAVPSGRDFLAAYESAKDGGAKELLRHTPAGNDQGTWYRILPDPGPDGRPRFRELFNPYAMKGPIRKEGGYPQVRIPAGPDATARSGGPSGAGPAEGRAGMEAEPPAKRRRTE